MTKAKTWRQKNNCQLALNVDHKKLGSTDSTNTTINTLRDTPVNHADSDLTKIL